MCPGFDGGSRAPDRRPLLRQSAAAPKRGRTGGILGRRPVDRGLVDADALDTELGEDRRVGAIVDE